MEQPVSQVLMFWIPLIFSFEMEAQGLQVWDILFTLSTGIPFTLCICNFYLEPNVQIFHDILHRINCSPRVLLFRMAVPRMIKWQ